MEEQKKLLYHLLGSPPYSAMLLQINEIPSEASVTISPMVPWGKFLHKHAEQVLLMEVDDKCAICKQVTVSSG
jgi:hypothetical protein